MIRCILFGMAAIAAMLVASAACRPAAAQPTEPVLTSNAPAPAGATQDLYGPESEAEQSESTDDFTYALVLNNREWSSKPQPNAKYRVMAEVKTDAGIKFFYRDTDWGFVPPGELDDGRFFLQKKRVVAVRFHWKDRLVLGHWYASDWVQADDGKYLYYVQIHWTGENDYVKPIFKVQRPIPVATQEHRD